MALLWAERAMYVVIIATQHTIVILMHDLRFCIKVKMNDVW